MARATVMSDLKVEMTDQKRPLVLKEGCSRFFGAGPGDIVGSKDVRLVPVRGGTGDELGHRAFWIKTTDEGIEVVVPPGNRHWVQITDPSSGIEIKTLKPRPSHAVREVFTGDIEISVLTAESLYRVTVHPIAPIKHYVEPRERNTPWPAALAGWNLDQRTHRVILATCARALYQLPGVPTHSEVAELLRVCPFPEDEDLSPENAKKVWHRSCQPLVKGLLVSAQPPGDGEEDRAWAAKWLVHTGQVDDQVFEELTGVRERSALTAVHTVDSMHWV
jgi:hypothetical protein